MSILLIGGTGTVGRHVVAGLHAKRARQRVMTREADKARHLPDGVEAVLGDLAEPRTLPTAFAGIEKLFMITPVSANEAKLGLAGVEAAKKAGVEHIVYMTIHNLEAGAHIPHFGSKIGIAEAIRKSGIPYTFIEPNSFFQNDAWYREPIADLGIYPQPLGPIGVSRVDARDIAHAVVNVLTEPGHEGARYPLVGPDVLTGEGVAKIWGRELGREVRYVGDDLEAWEKGARSMMPGWLVEDLRVMYEFFLDRGLVASAADLKRCRRVLGRKPRRFEGYARDLARAWKKSRG